MSASQVVSREGGRCTSARTVQVELKRSGYSSAQGSNSFAYGFLNLAGTATESEPEREPVGFGTEPEQERICTILFKGLGTILFKGLGTLLFKGLGTILFKGLRARAHARADPGRPWSTLVDPLVGPLGLKGHRQPDGVR